MRRLLIFLLTLMVSFSCLTCSAYGDLFTVSYTTYETTYDAILNMYIQVINAYGDDGHHHDLYNSLIVDCAPEMPVKELYPELKKIIGYCFYDLNSDGIDELMIGTDCTNVLEVFTLDEGKVRELIRAGRRYNCTLLEGGYFYRFCNSGGGGSIASSTIWKMNGTSAVSYVSGYHEDDEFGAYYGADGLYHVFEYQWFRLANPDDWTSSADTVVSIEEYLSWLKSWDNVLPLTFIPLSLYEQGIKAENAGIISLNGKTDGRGKVNIRTEARKNSRLLKEVKTGKYVTVLGEEGNYYRISFDGLEGYVQKDFLTLLSAASSEKNASIYPYEGEDYIRKLYYESQSGSTGAAVTPVAQDEPQAQQDSSQPTEDTTEYVQVLDHYEDVEVQHSRQVYDHDEYVMEDAGDGTFREVARPVYRTEYYYETEQVPVYIWVPKSEVE